MSATRKCQHIWHVYASYYEDGEEYGIGCTLCGESGDEENINVQTDRLIVRVASLERWAAAWKRVAKQQRAALADDVNRIDMLRSGKLLARIEELEAALRPLAALWRDGMERDPDSKTLWDHPDITVGDIRRAQRVLGEE